MTGKQPIYFDYAAATPMDKRVIAAMAPYFAERFHNPSATYLAAKEVAKDIENARASVARWLGARPAEIVFTAGGTEANNLAIHGVMGKFPKGNMVVSAIEHDSVLEPAHNYEHKIAPVTPEGFVDVAALEGLIDHRTVLVSVMYANNEIGTIQPIRQVAQIIGEIRQQRRREGNNTPLFLHTDACQAAAYLDLHNARLGIDLMTVNGGKIYGPKQSGALFVKTGTPLMAVLQGGGQERGLRSGTENVAATIGFAEALNLAQANRREEAKRLTGLQQLLIRLLNEKVASAKVNGSLKHRLPGNVHITFLNEDNERLLMLLDEHGIQCAAGSACSADSGEPSHVLKAIGLSDKEAQASLRFTMGSQTREQDIKTLVDTLTSILHK